MIQTFTPTPKQITFSCAVKEYEEVGYGGARGGAKTVGGVWVAIEHMSLLWPGNVGLICRYDLVDLERTTMLEFDRFLKLYHPQLPVKWNRSSPIYCDLMCAPNTWSRVYFSDAKDPVSWQSGNLGWCFLDEASEITGEFVNGIRGALGRHRLPDGRRPPKRLFWASNPGPGWCKSQFPIGKTPGRIETVVETPTGEEVKIYRAFIPAFPRDNPHLPVTWEAELRENNPETWCNRFLDGDWDAFEGQVFGEFDDKEHCFDFSFITTGMNNLVVLDWGFRSMTACLLVSIDYDGVFWVSREYRASGRDPGQHKPYIEKLAEGVNVRRWIMDYAAVNQSDGIPISRQFREIGLMFQGCGKKDKNGPDGAIMFLKQLMKAGRFKVHESCAGLITELKEAMWEKQTAQQADKKSPKERMQDINDHSIDALFMALDWYRQKPVKLTGEAANERDRREGRKRAAAESRNEIVFPDEYGVVKARKFNQWQM